VSLPAAHESGESGPHGGGEGGTALGVALEDLDVEVNVWHFDSISKLLVGINNRSVELGLDLGLEVGGGETKSGHEGSSVDGTDGGGGDLSEKLAALSAEGGDTVHVHEGCLDGLLTIDGDGNLQVAGGSGLTSGELSSACALDKHAAESDSLAGAVLGEDLWNEYSEVVSCDSNVQVLLEQVSQVKRVSGGEAGLEGSLDRVVGQVALGIFALGVVEGESGWCISRSLDVLSVEEGTVDTHLEDGVSCELWATDLSVVDSNASEEWDLLLAAIDLQVLVDLIVDHGDGGGLDLLDHLWDHSALKERDEDTGNLGNESSGELDINVIWIDGDSELLGIKLWSKLVGWGRWLGACVELDVDSSLVDLDVSLAVDVEEGPLVVEVGGQLDG